MFQLLGSLKCLSPRQALPLQLFLAHVCNMFCCFWNLFHFSSCYERAENRQWFDPRMSYEGEWIPYRVDATNYFILLFSKKNPNAK